MSLNINVQFYFAETITLTFAGMNFSRSDIGCPGDTISHTCSVLSSNRNLIWTVTIPGQTPVTITYNTSSELGNSAVLRMGIKAIMTSLVGEYIESTLTLTITGDFSLDGTEIQCSSGNLNSDIVEISVNTSGICLTELLSYC